MAENPEIEKLVNDLTAENCAETCQKIKKLMNEKNIRKIYGMLYDETCDNENIVCKKCGKMMDKSNFTDARQKRTTKCTTCRNNENLAEKKLDTIKALEAVKSKKETEQVCTKCKSAFHKNAFINLLGEHCVQCETCRDYNAKAEEKKDKEKVNSQKRAIYAIKKK